MKRISSEIKAIDDFCGGFPVGGVCVIRTLNREADSTADFCSRIVKHYAVEADMPVNVLSLGCSAIDFAKSLCINEPPCYLKRIGKAPIWITEKRGLHDSPPDIEEVLDVLDYILKEAKSRVIVVDGINEIADLVTPDCELFVSALLDMVDGKDATVIAIDNAESYDDNVEVPSPRPDNLMEMELLMGVDDIVQAAIYSGEECATTVDLYGDFQCFQDILSRS
ncbi:MAG: hypothetical protein IJ904_06330 [Candidatus Methanomethylophilaceae archaeon]|nr:hypothetical protein [Candidatus Methanomethylophilaceae archaeon]